MPIYDCVNCGVQYFRHNIILAFLSFHLIWFHAVSGDTGDGKVIIIACIPAYLDRREYGPSHLFASLSPFLPSLALSLISTKEPDLKLCKLYIKLCINCLYILLHAVHDIIIPVAPSIYTQSLQQLIYLLFSIVFVIIPFHSGLCCFNISFHFSKEVISKLVYLSCVLIQLQEEFSSSWSSMGHNSVSIVRTAFLLAYVLIYTALPAIHSDICVDLCLLFCMQTTLRPVSRPSYSGSH